MNLREDSERPTSWEMRVTNYEYLDIIATYGYLALIYHGIRTMEQTYERLYGDSERKHNEFMAESRRRQEESKRRHEKTMADIRRREEESLRKHDEAMADIRRRHEESMAKHEESMARHEESMTALRALIERTG